MLELKTLLSETFKENNEGKMQAHNLVKKAKKKILTGKNFTRTNNVSVTKP